MPLGKADNPSTVKNDPKPTPAPTPAPPTPENRTETLAPGDHSATNAVIDAGAGAPAGMRAAAEDLPEKDDVQKKIKEAMLADDAQTEAQAKAAVVDLSPDSDETPSGIALKAVAGITDDVKRGEEYTRIKSAVRHGYVPADDESLKAKQ